MQIVVALLYILATGYYGYNAFEHCKELIHSESTQKHEAHHEEE